MSPKNENKTIWVIIVLSIVATSYIIYDTIFNCNYQFEEYSDGWYHVSEESEIDSWGNSNSYLVQHGGPYTEKEVEQIISDCKQRKGK